MSKARIRRELVWNKRRPLSDNSGGAVSRLVRYSGTLDRGRHSQVSPKRPVLRWVRTRTACLEDLSTRLIGAIFMPPAAFPELPLGCAENYPAARGTWFDKVSRKGSHIT
jgi:hypothetical protein